MALLAVAPRLSAQETIFDPENPYGPHGSETDRESASDHETIFDPEHPFGPSTESSEAPILELGVEPTQPSWFGGYVLSRLYVDTHIDNDLEDVFMFQNRLELWASGELTEHWRAIIEGRFEYWLRGESNPDGVDLLFNGENYQGLFEVTLRDAFLSARYGGFFLTLGNQAVIWGAGTLSQPAAVINPVDYRYGVFGAPSDYRLPIFAAHAAFVVDWFSLSAVLVPLFEANLFNVFGTDFALFNASQRPRGILPIFEQLLPQADPTLEPHLQGLVAVTEWPAPLPKNSSAGARITGSFGGLDVGLGYYYGWDRLPFAMFESDDETGTTPEDGEEVVSDFSSQYLRQHTVEGDIVFFLGRIGVRAEVVYHPEHTVYLEYSGLAEPSEDSLEAARLPVVIAALALSYERSESLVIQVEGLWRHTFDVPAQTRPIPFDKDYHAIVFLFFFGLDELRPLRGTFIDALSFEITGVVSISNEEYALYPSVIWSFGDKVDLSLGAMLYGGPDLEERFTVGGLFDENDQIYASIDWRF